MNVLKIASIRTEYLLFACLLLAAVLRVLFLDHHSFWVDELFSIQYANLSLGELIPEIAANDNHPPLYYVLLHFWIQLFGDTEFAVRSLSLIFGVIAVAFVYRLGVLLYDERVGILAALFLSVAKYSIYWSQEARMYSLLSLLAVASVYYFWKLMHKPSLGNTFSYVVMTVLLLYTQSYGIFIVVAQNGYLLTIRLLAAHRKLKLSPIKWITLQLGVLALFLPWLTVLAGRVAQLHSEGFWVVRPTMMTVAGTFSEFSGSGPLLRILLLSLIFMSAVSITIIFSRSRDRHSLLLTSDFKAIFLLFSCLLVPIALPFIISQFSTPIYVNRAAGVGYFAFSLLVAKGLTSIKIKPLYYATLASVLALSLYVLANKGYVHHNQGKYRELAEYVTANAPASALIITCDDGQMSWPFSHYSRIHGLRAQLVELNDDKIKVEPRLATRVYPVVWLITSQDQAEAMRICHKVPELLRQAYRNMKDLEVPIQSFGISIYSDPIYVQAIN
jgi:mannosyltransferase